MRIIRVVLLFAMLIAKGADAISDEDKEKLAEMFSPILILTEETRKVYDDETTCTLYAVLSYWAPILCVKETLIR